MSDDFLTAVKQALQFLIGSGYRILRDGTGESFDNAGVFYQSDRLWISVSRERGEVSFTLGSMKGEGQFDQQIVQLIVDHAEHYPQNLPTPMWTLAEAETLLRTRLPEIEDAFSPARFEDTRKLARALGEERAHALFDEPGRATGAV
jgi:hypothetical protein